MYCIKKIYLNLIYDIEKIFFQGIHSPRSRRLRTPKLDKCDQYLKSIANPELVHHYNVEDPFLKL